MTLGPVAVSLVPGSFSSQFRRQTAVEGSSRALFGGKVGPESIAFLML